MQNRMRNFSTFNENHAAHNKQAGLYDRGDPVVPSPPRPILWSKLRNNTDWFVSCFASTAHNGGHQPA